MDDFGVRRFLRLRRRPVLLLREDALVPGEAVRELTLLGDGEDEASWSEKGSSMSVVELFEMALEDGLREGCMLCFALDVWMEYWSCLWDMTEYRWLGREG